MRCILFCCCCCCCWSFKFLQTYFTGLTLIPWCTAGLYCIADWWVFSDDVQLGEKGTFTPKEIIFEQINGIKARVIARKLSETRWHHLNNLPNFFWWFNKRVTFWYCFHCCKFSLSLPIPRYVLSTMQWPMNVCFSATVFNSGPQVLYIDLWEIDSVHLNLTTHYVVSHVLRPTV